MTDSEHEMEILSTSFEQEYDGNNDTAKIRNTNQKAANLEKNIECPKTDSQNDILTDMPVIFNDSNEELIDPMIVVNNGSKNENVFIYEQHHTKLIENHNRPVRSVNNGQKKEGCCNSKEYSHSAVNNNCKKRNKDSDNDFEKEAIRDDLMSMAAEMKLLNQQNCDLLNKIECSKKQTDILSNSIQKRTTFMRYKPQDRKCTEVVPKIIDTNSKVQNLLCENSQLRDALKEMKVDRCQTKLDKKISKVTDSQFANCVGKEDESKVKKLTKELHELLAHYNDKLSENEILRSRLDDEIHNNKTYEDRLMISKTQVVQLEKQLFNLNLIPSNDLEVVRQNDQYLIESLKHRLREANKENINLKTMFDFHMTELEDKKSKYLAVLQTNEEQKHYIEILCEQKCTIAKEYEVEFNRINEHMQKCLKEVEALSALLATTQQDLEEEKSAKEALKENLENLENEIAELKKSVVYEDNNCEEIRKELEEENLELKATIVTLTDNLDESQRRFIEQSYCLLQLKEQLDIVREEAAIQVTKVKDVSNYHKSKYTDYIQNLETNLAKCRAVACAEFKKRDRVDGRLRNQIETLTKSLNEAYKKINDFQDTNKLIELKLEEELCKVPLKNVLSKCRGVNNYIENLKDN